MIMNKQLLLHMSNHTQRIHHITNLQTMCHGQFSNMAPFRPQQHRTRSPAKFDGSRTNLSGLPYIYQNILV